MYMPCNLECQVWNILIYDADQSSNKCFKLGNYVPVYLLL